MRTPQIYSQSVRGAANNLGWEWHSGLETVAGISSPWAVGLKLREAGLVTGLKCIVWEWGSLVGQILVEYDSITRW